MVAMALMGTLTLIFTTALIQVYRASNRTDALAGAQSQLHTAFGRLDTHVRYALWIRPPVETAGYSYVEFLTTNPNTDLPQCGRLVLDRDAGVLRLAAWPRAGTPAAQQPVLASQVVLAAGMPPVFEIQQPGSYPYASPGPTAAAGAQFTPEFQRLRVRLTTKVGVGENEGAASSDVTFTAVNTSRTTVVPDNDCTEGRPTP
jgi:hypothetical protein